MTPAGRAPTPDCHYYYYYEEEEEKAEEEESVEGMKEAWACLKPHSLAMAVLKTILEQIWGQQRNGEGRRCQCGVAAAVVAASQDVARGKGTRNVRRGR